MEKVLSVVIPTYNTGKYLKMALESCIVDSVIDKLDVLIINDGSTDNSRDVGMDYVERYPGTFRMIDKENGGHGSAINLGIEYAVGKYFKVVDADDWMDKDGVLALIRNLEKFDVDMLISPFLWYFEKKKSTKREIKDFVPGTKSYQVYSAKEIMDRIFLKMHSLTFRTSILKSMPDRLAEHCFYVDLQFIVYPLPYIESIVIIDEVVYMYRLGIDEQSMNIKNMIKRNEQHEKVLESLFDFYGRYRKSSCSVLLEKTIARVVTSQYKIYLCMKNSQYRFLKMEKKLQECYPNIYDTVSNKAIQFLRFSKCYTYPIFSWFAKLRYGLLWQLKI